MQIDPPRRVIIAVADAHTFVRPPIPCYVTVTLYFDVLRDAIGDFAFIAFIPLAVTLRFTLASYLQ